MEVRELFVHLNRRPPAARVVLRGTDGELLDVESAETEAIEIPTGEELVVVIAPAARTESMFEDLHGNARGEPISG